MRAFRKTANHETAVARKNAVLAEEVTDYRTGDRVMTVDGFPGRVTAVLFGPYQNTESYQVVLDGGMGGGDYAPGQLSPIRQTTSSRIEASEILASIPVEAVTDHTANIDYPELETILSDRLPNENIRILGAQNINQMDRPDSSKEDSTENLEQQQQIEEPTGNPVDDPDGDPEEEQGDQSEEADNGEPEAKVGDVTPPSACSFCGGSSFSDPQMTGRGVRIRCDQCGGTMKSWGGQWEPEFPNSPQNHASEQGDYRSGGAAGVANAPGANFKTTMLQVTAGMTREEIAESLQSQAGIVQWLFNRMYDKARQHYDETHNEWWLPPVQDLGTNLEGPAHYQPPPLVTPKRVTVGSQSEYDDPEWKWHFTASWLDVQAKARRIRRDHQVKIVVASKLYVTAEVQGDTATYETQLNYVPGTRKVADWSCGCKWASYAWGRSPRYRRFEGRLCSHALATQYEASARGIFGRDVEPDRTRPDWQKAYSPVVVQYDKGKDKNLTRRAVPPANMRRTFSSKLMDIDEIYPQPELLDLNRPPVFASLQTMLDHGAGIDDAIEILASFRVEPDEARVLVFEALLSTPIDGGYSQYGEGPESGSELSTAASSHTANRFDAFDYGHDMGYDYADRLNAYKEGMAEPHPGDYEEERNHHANSWFNQRERQHVLDGFDHGSATWGNEHESGLPHRGGKLGKVLRRTHIFEKGQDKPLCAAHQTAEPKQRDGIFDLDSDKEDRCRTCEDLLPENIQVEARPLYHEAVLHEREFGHFHPELPASLNGLQTVADYSTADPLVSMDAGQLYRQKTPHSNSENPASTGFATSQDPGDWGKSLISNDFGVTFDASLHTQSDLEPLGLITPHRLGNCRVCGRSMPIHLGDVCPYCDQRSNGPDIAGGSNLIPLDESGRPAVKTWAHTPVREMTPDDMPGRFRALNTLHEEPEAALPFTDGGVTDDTGSEPLAGNSSSPHGNLTFDNDLTGTIPGVELYNSLAPSTGAKTDLEIIAEFQKSAGAKALMTKEASKDFNFEEQQELINEGKGSGLRARNFGGLNITGTHYELIGDDGDDDETILWI